MDRWTTGQKPAAEALFDDRFTRPGRRSSKLIEARQGSSKLIEARQGSSKPQFAGYPLQRRDHVADVGVEVDT